METSLINLFSIGIRDASWLLLNSGLLCSFNSYLLKVKNRNTRKRCEICSRLTAKKPEWRYWPFSGVLIVNFWHVSQPFLVFLLLTLNKAGCGHWVKQQIQLVLKQAKTRLNCLQTNLWNFQSNYRNLTSTPFLYKMVCHPVFTGSKSIMVTAE